MESNGLILHSPYKFRHGRIHYGLSHAKNIADFKAVSMNAMHASMEITDDVYSVLDDGEVQSRIISLGKDHQPDNDNQEILDLFKEFLSWKNDSI